MGYSKNCQGCLFISWFGITLQKVHTELCFICPHIGPPHWKRCKRYSCPYICNLPKHEKWVLSLILGSKRNILYIVNDIEKQIYLSLYQYVMHEWIQCKCTWYSKQNAILITDNPLKKGQVKAKYSHFSGEGSACICLRNHMTWVNKVDYSR